MEATIKRPYYDSGSTDQHGDLTTVEGPSHSYLVTTEGLNLHGYLATAVKLRVCFVSTVVNDSVNSCCDAGYLECLEEGAREKEYFLRGPGEYRGGPVDWYLLSSCLSCEIFEVCVCD